MTLFSEIRLHRVRTVKTLAMYFCFVSYGLTAGLIGPTLLDLQLMTNSTLDRISYMLPAKSAGGILGSLLMGAVYPYINFQLFVSLSMAATVLLHVAIPLNRTFQGLIWVFFINGIFGGFAGSGANIHLIELWGKENAPFMQALHFCYGLGALLAPLIARPFLLQEGDGDAHGMMMGGSTNSSFVDELTPTKGSSKYTQDDVLLIYPYCIVAGFTMIPAIFYFALWRIHPKSNTHPSRRDPNGVLPKCPSIMPNVPSVVVFDAIMEHMADQDRQQEAKERDLERMDIIPEEVYEDEDILSMKVSPRRESIGHKPVPQSDEQSLVANNDGDKSSKDPLVVTPDEGNKKIVVAVIDTPPPSESTTPSASSSSPSLPSIGKDDGVIPKSEATNVVDPRTTPTYRAFKILAIGLMMCFMPIYYGLEMTVGSFLTTFSVESDLHLSKASGAYMTSVYWSMFTFVRLSTVFYIDYVGAEMNVIMNLCVILVANIFLIPWGATYEWALWAGSTLMGIGCSSIWASAFGYLEDYFPVSSRIASLIMMSTALGDFVFPFVISHKITEYPNVFLDVTLFCSIAISLIFALVVVICKLRLRVKGTNAVAASTGQEEKKHFH